MRTAFFRTALFDSWRGYTRADAAKDLGAGLTVGVIALPLAIGFGIASGVMSGQGLWTAIITGFLILHSADRDFKLADRPAHLCRCSRASLRRTATVGWHWRR